MKYKLLVPPAPALSAHRHQRRVEFAETDMEGMVHFSVYLRYVEEAEHALWRTAGLRIADPQSRWAFPRVAATVEYHAPLRFEDLFEVNIEVESMSRRSIRYRSEIWRGENRVASSTHTAVCVDRRQTPLQAVALPPEVTARLKAVGH